MNEKNVNKYKFREHSAHRLSPRDRDGLDLLVTSIHDETHQQQTTTTTATATISDCRHDSGRRRRRRRFIDTPLPPDAANKESSVVQPTDPPPRYGGGQHCGSPPATVRTSIALSARPLRGNNITINRTCLLNFTVVVFYSYLFPPIFLAPPRGYGDRQRRRYF